MRTSISFILLALACALGCGSSSTTTTGTAGTSGTAGIDGGIDGGIAPGGGTLGIDSGTTTDTGGKAGTAGTTGIDSGIATGTGGTTSGGRSALGSCSSSSSQVCTGEEAYSTCITQACSAQITACYGPAYASGTYAGACTTFLKCQAACPCDSTATTCETNCTSQFMTDATCMTCLQTYSACVKTSGCVAPVCTGSTTPDASVSVPPTGVDGGTAAAAGCAEALKCCTALTAKYGAAAGQTCQSTVATSTDAVCATLVAQYKPLGMCD
jgi:hypothetical protein